MTHFLAEEIDDRFFEHGGRLDIARKVFPNAPEPWVDLSTGISPWAYPGPQASIEERRLLTDAGALRTLLEIARKRYQAPSGSEVVALPGTDAGLSILPWLFREPKRVAVLTPAYSGHEAAWQAAGHSVTRIERLDAPSNAAVLVAVNPNNPDGRLLSQAELAATLPPLKRRDGLLIVDEAFCDADEKHSLLPTAARLDYTLVLRSVGKFYGAGGVRLGFAITSHPIAQRLKAALGAWPVSAEAVAFGQAAFADGEWATIHRARLATAAGELNALLIATGLRVVGGTVLFRLAEHRSSAALFMRLAKQGILTRPFRDRAALRFGLPKDDNESMRLRAALMSSPF